MGTGLHFSIAEQFPQSWAGDQKVQELLQHPARERSSSLLPPLPPPAQRAGAEEPGCRGGAGLPGQSRVRVRKADSGGPDPETGKYNLNRTIDGRC